MEEDVRKLLGASPKYCLIVTPTLAARHNQGVLVAQWQQSVHPDIHGRQTNPVRPVPPTNPVKNTFIASVVSLNQATTYESPAHSSTGTWSESRASSHCLGAYGFMFYFTPRWGFFSPFPHGTTSLSVTQEYLALQGGPC
ncbi:hypothetical protein AAZX31_14G150600 [Glycine max]